MDYSQHKGEPAVHTDLLFKRHMAQQACILGEQHSVALTTFIRKMQAGFFANMQLAPVAGIRTFKERKV